jgi:hypothetical protein
MASSAQGPTDDVNISSSTTEPHPDSSLFFKACHRRIKNQCKQDEGEKKRNQPLTFEM